MANAIGSSSIASPPHSRKAVTITMQKGTSIILLCGVGKARLPALSKAQKPSCLWIRKLMRCNNQIQESSYRIPMFTMLLEARQNLKIASGILKISHVSCLGNLILSFVAFVKTSYMASFTVLSDSSFLPKRRRTGRRISFNCVVIS